MEPPVIGRACTRALTGFLVATGRRRICAPMRRREGSKMALKMPLAALTIAVMFAPAAHADPSPQNSGQSPVVRTVFNQPSNIPGKSVEAVAVSYPPGAKSGPHHHAKSAFIMAYVISGA